MPTNVGQGKGQDQIMEMTNDKKLISVIIVASKIVRDKSNKNSSKNSSKVLLSVATGPVASFLSVGDSLPLALRKVLTLNTILK